MNFFCSYKENVGDSMQCQSQRRQLNSGLRGCYQEGITGRGCIVVFQLYNNIFWLDSLVQWERVDLSACTNSEQFDSCVEQFLCRLFCVGCINHGLAQYTSHFYVLTCMRLFDDICIIVYVYSTCYFQFIIFLKITTHIICLLVANCTILYEQMMDTKHLKMRSKINIKSD